MKIFSDDVYVLVAAGSVLCFTGAVIVAARRFARKREREGAWDKDGPRNPTPPPGDWGMVPGYGAHRPQIEEEDDEPGT